MDGVTGIASGLMGNGQMSGRDTTGIDPKILALMRLRAQQKKDTTPVWTKEDAIKAINEGYKGMTQAQRDSAAAKFDHKAYIQHLEDMGFQVVPKQQ